MVPGTPCLPALILNLDSTIVNVALPVPVPELGATTTGLQWVVDADNLVFAALAWISTVSLDSSYGVIAGQMVLFGPGMGVAQSPATEAIMGAAPSEKGGTASAVNGSTRLFGGTLGVAVMGSVASSLYTSRLATTLPPGLPAPAAAARGSVGGAAIAAEHLTRAGLARQATTHTAP